MTTRKNNPVRWLVESALLIAVATVLNEYTKIPWAFGGGVTVCSMLPLVMLSFRFGWKKGAVSAAAFSLLQLFFGMDNVQYATSALMAAGIVLLDYLVPYTAIGLAGIFRKEGRDSRASYVYGIVATFAIRLACHFVTGAWIWDALWPNEFGWAAPLYSIAYNGSYMLAEMVFTSVVVCLLHATALRPYLDGEDLK